jgi:predicted small secreted protein
MLRRFARHLPIAALLLSAVACNTGADAGDDIRGGGAPSAKLNAAQKAGAYDAALREAFNVDSELVLLIDRSILPRSGGWESRDTLDAAVVRELRSAGAIRGECVPVRKDTKHGPTCVSNAPGYVVRVTDLFQVRGDTVRMFLPHSNGDRTCPEVLLRERIRAAAEERQMGGRARRTAHSEMTQSRGR